MSPPITPPTKQEITSAHLASLIEGLKHLHQEHNTAICGRLATLEAHLVDPVNPERTLPIRVRDVEVQHKALVKSHEETQRAVRKGVWAVLGGGLATLGSVVAAKLMGGGPPHP